MTEAHDLMKRWTTPAELDPELGACLREGHFGTMIKHRFVNEIFYVPTHNARYNEALAVKRAAAEQAAAERKWLQYILIHERPWRLEALLDVADEMTDIEYWKTVADVWTDSENIWQNLVEWTELLSDRRPGHEAMMTEDEKMALWAMPDEITIWRGHRDWNQDGWSWTVDRDKAVWFARRLAAEDDEMYVTEARVDKADVVAYFEGRGESEVVVDPEVVRHVNVVTLG